jgi:hypothetical protein
MHRYEIFLRYYVLGLADAGSSYAFHTLGSTLAIHALAYAKVRGFPRRNAGEDFYLMNKLAKVGEIRHLGGAPLLIRGRPSHRVPFGTGAALKQITGAAARGEAYRVYAPEVFLQLKICLTAIELACADRMSMDPRGSLERAAQLHGRTNTRALDQAITELGLFSALSRAKSISTDQRTMARHVHTWFDAFRTLKLIHTLSRRFPKVELIGAVQAASFVRGTRVERANLEELRRRLFRLEQRWQATAPCASHREQRSRPCDRMQRSSSPFF